MHVTLRVRRGVPNLRGRRVFRAVFRALGAGCERFRGRLVHFSVQTNHVHLLVEAADGRALSRFMQGLAIRVARAVNAAVGRQGGVFSDRFHARALATPLEVKRALAYVLENRRKHVARRGGGRFVGVLDACSSAAWFDGWSVADAACRAIGRPRAGPHGEIPIAAPRTWLLRVGWRRRGLLEVDGVRGHSRAAHRIPAAHDAK